MVSLELNDIIFSGKYYRNHAKLSLEELTARYERMTEVLEVEMYMMQGYLTDETKISYDFKDIFNNWSSLTMKDLDRINSSIPRLIECLNEQSENAKQMLKKKRISKRLSSRNLGSSTDASRGNGEGMETMDR